LNRATSPAVAVVVQSGTEVSHVAAVQLTDPVVVVVCTVSAAWADMPATAISAKLGIADFTACEYMIRLRFFCISSSESKSFQHDLFFIPASRRHSSVVPDQPPLLLDRITSICFS